jgi:2-dehydro-3-deoxyphosphogluconate aldolase / (4S)-4-hydroxy-2-oxoglutarate aldolase
MLYNNPMQRTREQILNTIIEGGIVAIMRAPSAEMLGHISEALFAGGVSTIEVTMTTPKAIAGLEQLVDRFGERALIGVGSVIDAATCRDAIAAGAQFVVSPVFSKEVVETTRSYGKVSVPAGLTPTEILAAWKAGGDLVKVFPSTQLGPGYFREILAPLPQLRLVPTGGVDLKSVPDWIKAGAACLGIGAALVNKEAMAKGDWGMITANAKAFVEAIRSARGSK